MSSSDDSEDLALSIIISRHRAKRRKRSVWTKEWLQERETKSSYGHLFQKLKKEDLFSNYMRLSLPMFESLLEKVKGNIQRNDTVMRISIPPGARLEATLLYLISGLNYSRLQHQTTMHVSTLAKIIPETCDAIYKALKNDYLKVPTNEEDWKAVAEGFATKWNFPNCVGAIDGKHVVIQPPPNSGSFYSNHRGTHSIVLIAVVNSNYEFIYVDVEANGRISDGEVWNNCSLSALLENQKAKLPPPSAPLYSNKELPFVFVGDNAFSLKPYLMKPFPHRNQTEEQQIFSYRLSRARRVAENAFGVMANRFRILQTPILLHPNKAVKIVLACVVLHNFLRKENEVGYIEDGDLDQEQEEHGRIVEGRWRDEGIMTPLERTKDRNPSQTSKNIREDFTHYFNNEGNVSWQRKMCGLE